MNPADIRNMTFAEIQASLAGERQQIWQGLRIWGPCTTRTLAERMERDILAVRPRVTELCQLGMAELDGEHRDPGRRAPEGMYRALSIAEAQNRHARQGLAVQSEMRLMA